MIAPGGKIRLSSDWIAGLTGDVSWLKESLVPDRDQGKLQSQARVVLGDEQLGLRAWAAGWEIVSIGSWTMGKIGASPGRRPIRPVGAGLKPLGRNHRLPGVVRLMGQSAASWRSLGTHPLHAVASRPSPCGVAVNFQPTPRRREGETKCRRQAPLTLRNRIRPGPPWPDLGPGQRMTCSSWIAGSVQAARVQGPFEILLPRSRIPFPVVPYLAPPAVADLGFWLWSAQPFLVGPLATAGPSHRSRAGEKTSRITVSALP